MAKKVRRNERVNGDFWIKDYDTGEINELELGSGESLTYSRETSENVLKFKTYVSSCDKIEVHVQKVLSAADYKRYRMLGCWLNTQFNIVLSGNNLPHSLRSLSKELKLNEDDTRKFIRRLEQHGLAVWDVVPETGYEKKILMLNPHIIRKRTTVHKVLIKLFHDFSEVVKGLPSTYKWKGGEESTNVKADIIIGSKAKPGMVA